jgi:hypothetical protein
VKRRSRAKEIDSQKQLLITFPDKDNPESKTMGLVEDFRIAPEVVAVKVKPLVIKARFEGEPVQFRIRGRGIGKFYEEVLKKFESSLKQVLFLDGKNILAFNSKEDFNRFLEKMMHRMQTKEYLDELHKSGKKGYVV